MTMNGLRLYMCMLSCVLAAVPVFAQDNTDEGKEEVRGRKAKAAEYAEKYPDSYLDTVSVDKVFTLNDYTIVGFEYGAVRPSMRFTPVYAQEPAIIPDHYEVSLTRYGKMFNYMPYFGLKVAMAYSHQGYTFKENKETGYTPNISSANAVDYRIVELPIASVFHVDMPHFKIMAEVGPYAAYRLSIERTGTDVLEDYAHTFLDTDRRFDYGLRGGIGFGIVMSPIEFHVSGKVRYSWIPAFDPSYNSQYYYRYAYPFDFMLTAGVQFQITKRTGKTNKMLKKEAKQIVYGE